MKNFLLTFVAMLLAAGLALFAYDRLVLTPRLAAAAETERVNRQQARIAAQIDLENARSEAKRIASELDASVGQTVSDAKVAFEDRVAEEDQRRAELEAQAEQMRRTAQASEALMRANMVKVAVAEHYQNHGAWPPALADLGMGESGDFAGGAVAGITLEAGGVIVVSVKPEVAAGGKLRLAPTASRNGMIEWQCRASDFPAATRLPACKA